MYVAAAEDISGNRLADGPSAQKGAVMKGGAQTALAIGVGYILGRRRKMRVATALALGAATGGLGKLGPLALKRAGKFLGSTDIGSALGPQIGEIASTIRGDLVEAGKAAATSAVSGRIESLTDSLHDRAETLKNPEAAVAGAGETVGRAGRSVSRLGRRGKRAEDVEPEDVEPEDVEPEDEYEDEEPEEADDELDEPADEDEDFDEEEPEDDEEPEPEDAEAAPRRTRTSRSPVARTRR
jgi:hypothetical protein